MKDRHIENVTFEWEGILIEVRYEAAWLGAELDALYTTAHLEVRSIDPPRSPLPITETGYRSHFLHREEVDEAGGPESYVRTWLADAAKSPEWKSSVLKSKQLSLF